MSCQHFLKLYKQKHNLLCAITGFHAQKLNEIEGHHIIAVCINPDLCFEESNLILVKKEIHKQFHKLYGKRTTEKEWNEYLSIYYPDKAEKSNILSFKKLA